ncbi:fhkD [Symbiodinium sp. KB8]|nr:fhkD [Symbiodinium sp. KB8]
MATETEPSEWFPWNPLRFQMLRKLEDAPRNQGRVLLMRDTSTAMLVAVKQVPSWWMQENQSKFRSVYPYETEMPWMDVAYLAFLNQVGYHWACSLLGVYRDDTCTYIVTSLASHGDLFLWSSRLQLEPGPTREATVQPLAVQMLKAVQELHDLSIAHRDLSCENILVTQVDDTLEVRVIDFAAACGSRFSSGAHGKDMYVAPEVHLGGKFDTFLSDAFALGVIFLSVLLQRYPWNSTKPGCCKSFEYVRKHGLRKYLMRRKLSGTSLTFADAISDSCLHLLEGLLEVDPGERLTLGENAWSLSGDRVSVWSEDWVLSAPAWGREISDF